MWSVEIDKDAYTVRVFRSPAGKHRTELAASKFASNEVNRLRDKLRIQHRKLSRRIATLEKADRVKCAQQLG